MIARLLARLRRFGHGLRHLTHQNVDHLDDKGVRLLACSCGRRFWLRADP